MAFRVCVGEHGPVFVLELAIEFEHFLPEVSCLFLKFLVQNVILLFPFIGLAPLAGFCFVEVLELMGVPAGYFIVFVFPLGLILFLLALNEQVFLFEYSCFGVDLGQL